MTCRLGRESKQVFFPFVDCKDVAMTLLFVRQASFCLASQSATQKFGMRYPKVPRPIQVEVKDDRRLGATKAAVGNNNNRKKCVT
jgi:hypothetical protein